MTGSCSGLSVSCLVVMFGSQEYLADYLDIPGSSFYTHKMGTYFATRVNPPEFTKNYRITITPCDPKECVQHMKTTDSTFTADTNLC